VTLRSGNARAACEALSASGETSDVWAERAEANARVPTALSALGRDRTVDLLWHSYVLANVLAMCNPHAILGYPLASIPPRSEFEALVP
jgi:hypothetical protein